MYTQLDFSRFYSVDVAEQKEFCDALVSDLRQHGFARLVNHGVPAVDIDRAFETASTPLCALAAYGMAIETKKKVLTFPSPAESQILRASRRRQAQGAPSPDGQPPSGLQRLWD